MFCADILTCLVFMGAAGMIQFALASLMWSDLLLRVAQWTGLVFDDELDMRGFVPDRSPLIRPEVIHPEVTSMNGNGNHGAGGHQGAPGGGHQGANGGGHGPNALVAGPAGSGLHIAPPNSDRWASPTPQSDCFEAALRCFAVATNYFPSDEEVIEVLTMYTKDPKWGTFELMLSYPTNAEENLEMEKKLRDAIFALTYFVDNGEICRLACQILTCIAINSQNVHGHIVTTSAPELVLNAMDRHLHDGQVQRGAACVFWNVCVRDDIRLRLGARAVDLLFRLVETYKDSPDTQESALGALANISPLGALCEEVCTGDRIELLLCIIRRHRRSSLLLCAAFGLLNNIAGVERFRLKLGELGAIRLISHGMKLHEGQRKVQRNGCHALAHLAKSEENVHRCLRALIPELMYKVFRTAEWQQVRDYATRTLRMFGVLNPTFSTTSLHLAAKLKGDHIGTVAQILCGYHPPLFNKMVGPYARTRRACVTPRARIMRNPYSAHGVAEGRDEERHVHFEEAREEADSDGEEEKEEPAPEDADLYAYPTSFVLEDGEAYPATYVNVEDGAGRTALHLALKHHNNGVAEYLMKVGADPTLLDKKGRSVDEGLLIRRDERALNCNFDNGANKGRSVDEGLLIRRDERSINRNFDNGANVDHLLRMTEKGRSVDESLLICRDERSLNRNFDNGANVDHLLRMTEEAYVRKHGAAPYEIDVASQKGQVVTYKPRVTSLEVVRREASALTRSVFLSRLTHQLKDDEYNERIIAITKMRMMTEAVHRGHVKYMCLRASLADFLMDAMGEVITDELDANVFDVIASYCDLGSYQRHVRREELGRRVDKFVREQHRLRETFVHAIENGAYTHSNEFGFAKRYGPPPSFVEPPCFDEGAGILQHKEDANEEIFIPAALVDTTRGINNVDILRRRGLPVRSRIKKGAFGGTPSAFGRTGMIEDVEKENASPRKRKLQIEIGGGKVFDLSPNKRARLTRKRPAAPPSKRPAAPPSKRPTVLLSKRPLRQLTNTMAPTIESEPFFYASPMPTYDVNKSTQFRTPARAHAALVAAGALKRPPVVRRGQRADSGWAPFEAKVAELGLDGEEDEGGDASS